MRPARYHALRNRVLRAVDHVHAEPVWLRPVRGGAADPDREAIEIEAVLRVGEGATLKASGHRTDAAWRGDIRSEAAELHIDPAGHPGLVVRVGDEVRALSRPGQPWFEVLGIDDRGAARLVLQLGESA